MEKAKGKWKTNVFVSFYRLTLFVKKEKRQPFRARYLLWPKTCLGPKQPNQENQQKSGFQRKLPTTKNVTFFWRRFFEMVEKVGITDCVFGKLYFAGNTIYIVFSARHSNCRKICWKNRKFMKIVSCFWTWQEGVLLGVLLHFGFEVVGCVVFVCFYILEVLMFLWFVSCVFGKSYKCVSSACFFFLSFGCFLWVSYSCLFGFGGVSVRGAHLT